MSYSEKKPNIQILRGIAIVFVIIQHYHRLIPPIIFSKIDFLSYGFWTGVDIFFVISGFLIFKNNIIRILS